MQGRLQKDGQGFQSHQMDCQFLFGLIGSNWPFAQNVHLWTLANTLTWLSAFEWPKPRRLRPMIKTGRRAQGASDVDYKSCAFWLLWTEHVCKCRPSSDWPAPSSSSGWRCCHRAAQRAGIACTPSASAVRLACWRRCKPAHKRRRIRYGARGVVVRDHQDVRHRFLVSHCDGTVSPL
jgi:hypothetical protein